MTKLYIDYEWGQETPLLREDGSYFKISEVNDLIKDSSLRRLINIWSILVQHQFDWEDPSNSRKNLPEYIFEFISKIENDIVKNLETENILILNRKNDLE